MQYLFEGKWNPLRVEQETFHVKTATGMETITLPAYYTRHGPIVEFDRTTNTAYSIKSRSRVADGLVIAAMVVIIYEVLHGAT